MKIYSPLQLSVNQRVVEHNREFYWVVSTTLYVNLLTKEVLFEYDCIEDIMTVMGDTPMLDMGLPKPSAEYLVSGSFYSPQKTPVSAGQVGVTFAGHTKYLNIFGDRHWKAGLPSTPTSISRLPLLYDYSFGGPDSGMNPKGKGYQSTELPNIEVDGSTTQSNKTLLSPAGFGPLDATWQQRSQYQGSYDETYIQKYFPGFPADMDWRLFNTAPSDQWFDGDLLGNEAFELNNLHPTKSNISGELPGYLPRCFILDSSEMDADDALKELNLKLDTVWFFPCKEVVKLVWRGGMKVQQDEAEQVSHLLVAYEHRDDERRPIAHYQEALHKRVKGNNSLEDSLNTQDLVPIKEKSAMALLLASAMDGVEESNLEHNLSVKSNQVDQYITSKFDDSIASIKQQLDDPNLPSDKKKALLTKVEKVAEKNIGDDDVKLLMDKIDTLVPGAATSKVDFSDFKLDKLDSLFSEIDVFTDKKNDQVFEIIKPDLDKLKVQLDEIKLSNSMSSEQVKGIEQQIIKLENLNEPDVIELSPLPRVDTQSILEQISQLSPQIDDIKKQLHIVSSSPFSQDTDKIRQLKETLRELQEKDMQLMESEIRQAHNQFIEGYGMGAHFSEEGTSPHPNIHSVQKKLDVIIAGTKDASGGDWACLDLSGRNLDGVNFSNCLMEQVNLKGASLVGANFNHAVLVRSNFDNADCTKATFDGANIGASSFNQTNFTRAHFSETRLSKAIFLKCDFTASEVTEPEALDVTITQCQFNSAKLTSWCFLEQILVDVCFKQTTFTSCSFIKCQVFDSSFEEAIMPSMTIANTHFRNVNFSKTNLAGSCFVQGEGEEILFESTHFQRADLTRTNFQGFKLSHASFEGAIIDGANFSSTDLKFCNFNRSHGHQAMFRKSDLFGATFFQANLKEAVMSKAKLIEVNLDEANLYSVDFMRASVQSTTFNKANLDATPLKDWRPS